MKKIPFANLFLTLGENIIFNGPPEQEKETWRLSHRSFICHNPKKIENTRLCFPSHKYSGHTPTHARTHTCVCVCVGMWVSYVKTKM